MLRCLNYKVDFKKTYITMMYKIPLSFRRTITKLWQLPYIGGVILCIAILWGASSFWTKQIESRVKIGYTFDYSFIWIIDLAQGAFKNMWHQIVEWLLYSQSTYSWWYRIYDIILLCAAIFASFFFGSIIKYCYYKPRPEPQKYTNRWQKIDASSFPSIHTANSLILAFFGLMASGGLVIQNAPIRQQLIVQVVLPLFWILFYITISYSRVVLKKHFWIDLVGGTIFGALIVAWVIWQADMIIMIVWNVCYMIFGKIF